MRTPRHPRAAAPRCPSPGQTQPPGRAVPGPPHTNGPADTAPPAPARQLPLQPRLLRPTPRLLPHTGPSHSRHRPHSALGGQIQVLRGCPGLRSPRPALRGLPWPRRAAATAPPAPARPTPPDFGGWTGNSRDHRELWAHRGRKAAQEEARTHCWLFSIINLFTLLCSVTVTVPHSGSRAFRDTEGLAPAWPKAPALAVPLAKPSQR